jgi:anti-anti-sigma factor
MNFGVDSSPISDGYGLRLAVRGELDIASSDHLKRAADAAAVRGRPLILDLSDCTFIDSRGLGLILQINKELCDRSGRSKTMAIVIGESATRRLFTLTAINHTVPLFDTLDQAGVWLDMRRGPEGTGVSSAPRLT